MTPHTARHITPIEETDLDHLADMTMRIDRVEGAELALLAGEDAAHRGPYHVTVLLVVLSAVGVLMTGLVAALVP